MRSLLYLPVIHAGADMGSLEKSLGRQRRDVMGRERWEIHQQVIDRYWQEVETWCLSLEAPLPAIYQDGLLADGDLGRKIIRENAARGSVNFRIVNRLMEKGAEIRKTEDVLLLKEEYSRALRLAQTPSPWDRVTAHVGCQFDKDDLLERRDRYIAQTIGRTLNVDETGLLFIGAFHNVIPMLADDISVHEVKERHRIIAYYHELLTGQGDRQVRILAEYLSAPISGNSKS